MLLTISDSGFCLLFLVWDNHVLAGRCYFKSTNQAFPVKEAPFVKTFIF